MLREKKVISKAKLIAMRKAKKKMFEVKKKKYLR
jgi:hypothetical protein